MNGFLQWLYRASFFSPSSEADIRGGSPGSLQAKCFSIPLVGVDVSGAVLMCLKKKNKAVSNDLRWNDKDISENRLWLWLCCCNMQEEKQKHPVQ